MDDLETPETTQPKAQHRIPEDLNFYIRLLPERRGYCEKVAGSRIL
jgi:hypothetical protein